jgi:hypothetical protein
MKLLLKTPLIPLLFVALSAIVFLQCKEKTVPKTQNYFYADIAYFQLKNSDLLKCLIKNRGVDSCYCLDKYNDGGDPVPDDVTDLDDVCSLRIGCCPCQNDILFIKSNDNPQSPPKKEGERIPKHCCPCPDIFVLGEFDKFPLSFSLDNSKDRKPEDDLNRKVIKEEVTINNKKYYQYSFPKDFNEDVRITYRNTDLGSFTYSRGRVQSWCEHEHDDSHPH